MNVKIMKILLIEDCICYYGLCYIEKECLSNILRFRDKGEDIFKNF